MKVFNTAIAIVVSLSFIPFLGCGKKEGKNPDGSCTSGLESDMRELESKMQSGAKEIQRSQPNITKIKEALDEMVRECNKMTGSYDANLTCSALDGEFRMADVIHKCKQLESTVK